MKNTMLCLLICIVAVACNENLPDKDPSIEPANKTTQLPTATSQNGTTITSTIDSNSLPSSPQTNAGLPQSPATMVQQAVTANTVPANNPPHGQPGHVCGTTPPNNNPQNIQAPKNTAPQIVSNVVANNPQNAAVQAGTAQGMNPAHGQPGHRCDISVGAPLNSAPQKAPSPTTVVANQTKNNTIPTEIVAATSQANPNSQKSAIVNQIPSSPAKSGKLNPAHGQPGHDCKVAVGQPLP